MSVHQPPPSGASNFEASTQKLSWSEAIKLVDAEYRDDVVEFIANTLKIGTVNVASQLAQSAAQMVPGGSLILSLCGDIFTRYQKTKEFRKDLEAIARIVQRLAIDVANIETHVDGSMAGGLIGALEDLKSQVIKPAEYFREKGGFDIAFVNTFKEGLSKCHQNLVEQCTFANCSWIKELAERLNKVEGKVEKVEDSVDNLAAEVKALKVGQPTTKLSLEDVLNVVRAPFNHKAQALLYVAGTRENIISQVLAWCKSVPSKDSLGNVIARVRCHLADAGMGKTVVSSFLLSLGRLEKNFIAYHFCRHNIDELSNPLNMLKSIAWQLCQNSEFRAYKKLLNTPAMIRRISSSEGSNLSSLFNLLFLEPLSQCKLHIKHRRVILIDALDECNVNMKPSILTVIEKFFSDDRLPGWLAFLLTSRPKEDIDQALNRVDIHKVLRPFHVEYLEQKSEENRKDMLLYVRHELRGKMQSKADVDLAARILLEKSKASSFMLLMC